MSETIPPYSSTRLTASVGLVLTGMLSLMFLSGAFFFFYTFNANIPPWFTPVRFVHFYVGLASIPFLISKYGSTMFRFGGYYLKVPRFKKAGPPSLLPRIISPILAADFFALYFSGLYMIFHYYYHVTNIPPFDIKPVQLHFWSTVVAAPLITLHVIIHIAAAVREARGKTPVESELSPYAERPGAKMSRRALFGGLAASGLGLALLYQNTSARSWTFGHLFIGRIPAEERGGPGNFPVETLFGKRSPVDRASYVLSVEGEVDNPLQLSYDDILALPAYEHSIRISCVSGWTEVPTWKGPRVTDILALAQERAATKSVAFHSLSNYGFTWHRGRLNTEKAILATHVNGAPLSENHGFPVRLIVPGYPGENMVKQVDRIFVRKDGQGFDVDFQLT